MNWPLILELLERFQTSLIGLVGFGGVILTLRHNAKQAERNHAQQVAHERKTIHVALITELKINRFSLQENVQMLEQTIQENEKRQDGGGDGALVPAWTMTEAYESFLPKIGLLSAEQPKLVMYAYLTAALAKLTSLLDR